MSNLHVNDFGTHRKNAFAALGNYPMAGAYGHTGSQAAALRAAQYMQTGNPMLQQAHGDAGMAALANGFGTMNISPPQYGAVNRASTHVASTGPEYGNMPMSQAQALYMQGQSQYLYPGTHIMSGTTSASGASVYTPTGHYMPVGYAGFAHQMIDTSPQGQQNWPHRLVSDGSNQVPHLVTPRRDSVSSNEEHLPATPYGAGSFAGYHNGVSVMDRSPSQVFTHSGTPSPSQYMQGYAPQHMGKHSGTSQIPLALQLLVSQEPVIPRAIPAVNSPMKPLDRCLENKNGETNVYIRGLLPETTDEMLYNWGSRFGDIQSSKSIIDLKTNLCKGQVPCIRLPQLLLTITDSVSSSTTTLMMLKTAYAAFTTLATRLASLVYASTFIPLFVRS